MSKIRQVLKDTAHSVRDAVREVRKSFSSEYVHTTIEHIVDDLEARYPQPERGALKFRFAKVLLNRVLGRDYVDANFEFVRDLIALVVEARKPKA